jgi:hypothetical protein
MATGADPTPKQPERLSAHPLAKVSAFTGAAALIIGNLAGVLSNLEEIRATIFKWTNLDGLFAFISISRALVVVSLGIAFGIAAYWFYVLFVKGSRKLYQIVFFGLCVLAVPTIMFLGSRMVSPQTPSEVIAHQAKHLVDRIWAQQVSQGSDIGGIQYTSSQPRQAQAWTTAQALVGILSAKSDLGSEAGSVRAAFEYMERVRVPEDGWGYFPPPTGTKGVTEINAWVTVAYLQSLRQEHLSRIWPNQATAQVLPRVQRELADLAVRQHSDGCFGPIRGTSSIEQVRTYSTVMALWAMAEGRDNKLVSSQPWWNYDRPIQRSMECLLRHIKHGATGVVGWWPDPSIESPSGYYPGLTAHALFVLYRAGEHSERLSRDPRFAEVVSSFLNSAESGVGGSGALIDRPISANDRTHDMSRYLPGITGFQVESSTFLWYPWTLAAAVQIAQDNTRSTAVRRSARRLISRLLSRTGELTQFVTSDEALYPMSEALFAYGDYTSSPLVNR